MRYNITDFSNCLCVMSLNDHLQVRALSSFLTSVTTWTIRDKFARLSQMAALLNLETLGEVTEVGAGMGREGRLSTGEVRTLLGLRIDFKPEEIKKLRLS